jgi:uncharacterized protein (TIGR02271 family)
LPDRDRATTAGRARHEELDVKKEKIMQPQKTSSAPETLIASAGGSEVRVPIMEERLIPGTRPLDLGELRIHKLVDAVEETVRQHVTLDAVDVERIAINRPLDTPAERRTEGEWLVIPVMEEVLVVSRQLMLKEEVRIRTRQVTEEREVRETTRHERVEFEDTTAGAVHGLDQQRDHMDRPSSASAAAPAVGPRGVGPRI